jgi:hypothetical protein
MWIVIDLERLVVLYKHPNQAALVSLANIEVPSAPIVVMSATDPDSYERFTDFELKVLFENICGQKHTGYNRPFLIKSVVMLVGLLKETQLDPQEVELQLAMSCTPYSDTQWKYVFGANEPTHLADLYVPNALVSVAGYVPVHKRYFVPNAAHTPVKAVAGTNVLLPPPSESAPRTSRPNSNEVPTQPKSGSKTGKVWELAQQCYDKHPVFDKVLRKMVADACEAEGINSSTMSVQFSKYKQSKL